MAKFHILRRHPVCPWGDYFNILMHGMSCHLGRQDGRIQLERTGPFVPPISFPGSGDIVVTTAFRTLMEASGLSPLRFQPVIKKLIVRLDWHLWDRNAEDPHAYPEDGEPESYILDQQHSVETSNQMGDLWELVINQSARVHRPDRPWHTGKDIYLLPETWQGEDFFGAEGVGYIYVSERARSWLEHQAADYVGFEEAEKSN